MAARRSALPSISPCSFTVCCRSSCTEESGDLSEQVALHGRVHGTREQGCTSFSLTINDMEAMGTDLGSPPSVHGPLLTWTLAKTTNFFSRQLGCWQGKCCWEKWSEGYGEKSVVGGSARECPSEYGRLDAQHQANCTIFVPRRPHFPSFPCHPAFLHLGRAPAPAAPPPQTPYALTFQVRVVAVVDVLAGVHPLAQEALLMLRVHVGVQLCVAVEAAPAEVALRVALEAGLGEGALPIALAQVALQVRPRVE